MFRVNSSKMKIVLTLNHVETRETIRTAVYYIYGQKTKIYIGIFREFSLVDNENFGMKSPNVTSPLNPGG